MGIVVNERVIPYNNRLMTECPFIRKGMTDVEYWEERDYFIHHYTDYKNGTYQPLWKQRGETYQP